MKFGEDKVNAAPLNGVVNTIDRSKTEKKVTFFLETDQLSQTDEPDLIEAWEIYEDTQIQATREKIIELVEDEEDVIKLHKVELALEQLNESDESAEDCLPPKAKEVIIEKEPIPPDPKSAELYPKILISDEADSYAHTAATIADNRNYMQVVLGGIPYRALFDPGAVITLVGPKVAEKFNDRLTAAKASVQTVTGELSPVMGYLPLRFELEGVDSTITARAVKEIGHDVVLGKDFCEAFKIDTAGDGGEPTEEAGVILTTKIQQITKKSLRSVEAYQSWMTLREDK